MNEVFENILERIDSYIEDAKSEGDFSYIKPFEIAKIAVQKVAEEYNGGWIPCSERLPEEAFGCLVTVMDCEPSTQTDFENILPYFVGYDGETWNDIDGNVIPFEVIAWMPLPQPYQPKGE